MLEGGCGVWKECWLQAVRINAASQGFLFLWHQEGTKTCINRFPLENKATEVILARDDLTQGYESLSSSCAS